MPAKSGAEKLRTRRSGAVKPQVVRHINRAAVLELIRAHQPVSRAELARLTGIHRSNISLIVEDLQKDDLLEEKRGKSEGRGRTPSLLSFNRKNFGVIGVSMRSAKTTVALAALNGSVESTYIFDTPAEPAEFVDRMDDAYKEVTRQLHGTETTYREVRQVVISVPGIVTREANKTSSVWTPGLPKYSGSDLGAMVAKRTKVPTVVANNAGLGATAALHAAERNSDREMNDFVLLVVGDVGVGSGVVIQHNLYSGYDAAYAGEVGHTVIDAKGLQCNCGRRGCWQLYVCDAATWKRYEPNVPFTAARFREFLEKVNAGQAKALAVVRETAQFLSLGISNIALTLNPERILIAGAMTAIWPVLEKELKTAFFLPHHHAIIEPVEIPADSLFLRGAIERAIDLILAPAGRLAGR
jgi:predicted NBD/HSP70 family sugar kinase